MAAGKLVFSTPQLVIDSPSTTSCRSHHHHHLPSSSHDERSSKIQEKEFGGKRKTRDFLFGLIFIIFIGSLVSSDYILLQGKGFDFLSNSNFTLRSQSYLIADIAMQKKGNPNLLLKGYDNYGNICGEENVKIAGVKDSGINMTTKPFLMLTIHRNISLRSTCVSRCPSSDFLVSIFNRCLPRDTPIKLPALLILDAFNVSKNVVEAIVSDTAVCWKEVTYRLVFSISYPEHFS
jgi:hypothetical protein